MPNSIPIRFQIGQGVFSDPFPQSNSVGRNCNVDCLKAKVASVLRAQQNKAEAEGEWAAERGRLEELVAGLQTKLGESK